MDSPNVRSNVDFFAKAPIDVTSVASEYVPYYSVNDVENESAPLEIQIRGTPQNYIDLKGSFLCLKVKIVRSDKTKVNNFLNGEIKKKAADWKDSDPKWEYPEDQITPVNMWLYSLFETMEIWMNGKLMSVKTNQHYISYLKVLLGYSLEAVASRSLETALCYMDPSPASSIIKNQLYINMMLKIEGGKSVTMTGRIFHDLFEIDKYILPNVDLKLKFYRSKNNFALWSEKKVAVSYSVVFETFAFHCRKHVLSPSVHKYTMKTLEHNPAIYLFVNSEVKTFSIPQSSTEYVSENLFPWAQLPHRVLIGFINTTAYNGSDLDKNPWCFLKHDVSSIKVYVDSDGSTFKEGDLIYDSSDQILPLQILRNALRGSFAFGRDMFELGYMLYYYELTSSNAVKNGSLKIDVKFSKALTSPLTAIVFGQKNSVLSIDNTFNPTID